MRRIRPVLIETVLALFVLAVSNVVSYKLTCLLHLTPMLSVTSHTYVASHTYVTSHTVTAV